MSLFLALIHKEPDSAWGISFPDLPGCIAAADRSRDIFSSAREVLDLWFEFEPWVEPRDIEALREEVAEDLHEGAFLVGIPYERAEAKREAA